MEGSQQATLFAFRDTLEGVECHTFHAQSAFTLVVAVVVVFAAAFGAAVALADHYEVSARCAYFVAAVAVGDEETVRPAPFFGAFVLPGSFFTRTDEATSSEGFAVRYC